MSTSWLITGGSSGLGLSLGRAVLAKGATAVLTTRNIAKAQEAAPDIKMNGGRWLQLDFANPKLEQLVTDTVKQYDINVVVNNAGYSTVAAVEECRPEAIRAQYEANVIGPVRIIQAVIPIFRERKAGTIANIGSSATYSPMPGINVYASSKAALKAITEGLAAELAPFGIRVLLFEPGRFRTNFGAAAVISGPGEGYSEVYKGTPVEMLISRLRNAPPAPGNPDEAALRMYEVVTETGMGAEEGVQGRARFPLGNDAHEGLMRMVKGVSDGAAATEAIARSTDFTD